MTTLIDRFTALKMLTVSIIMKESIHFIFNRLLLCDANPAIGHIFLLNSKHFQYKIFKNLKRKLNVDSIEYLLKTFCIHKFVHK